MIFILAKNETNVLLPAPHNIRINKNPVHLLVYPSNLELSSVHLFTCIFFLCAKFPYTSMLQSPCLLELTVSTVPLAKSIYFFGV